jgi:DNA-binding transcriptional ArsR family regulator
MSTTTRKDAARKLTRNAQLFAALGDKVRLDLLSKLSDGRSCSITQLAAGSVITRQAITKHLRVLQDAGIVRRSRQGRESLFQLDPKPLQDARESLDVISRQWGDAPARLKSFVESE